MCGLTKNDGAGGTVFTDVDSTIATVMTAGSTPGVVTIDTNDKTLDGKTYDFKLSCYSLNASPSQSSNPIVHDFSVTFTDECHEALTGAKLNLPQLTATPAATMKVFDTMDISFNAATSTLVCGPITHEDDTVFTPLITPPLPHNYGSGNAMTITFTAPTSPGKFELAPNMLDNAG
jgi:hypothetical protein